MTITDLLSFRGNTDVTAVQCTVRRYIPECVNTPATTQVTFGDNPDLQNGGERIPPEKRKEYLMVIQNNLMAMNANRMLGVNNSGLAKNLEKLSSGYRINRAGDDAAGLAISEKMRAQIKGLEQAATNAQDGISLIQTAEGALTEVHNMLNRMVELATKSANGTIQDEVDREAIQAEVNALNEEITRIADATTFNGINLLDGSLSTKFEGSAALQDAIDAAQVALDALPGVPQGLVDDTKVRLAAEGATAGTNTILGTEIAAAEATVFSVDLQNLGYISATDNNGGFTLTIGTANIELTNIADDLNSEGLATALAAANGGVLSIGNADYAVTSDGSTLTFTMTNAAETGAGAPAYDGNFTIGFTSTAGTGTTTASTTGGINVGSQVISAGHAAINGALGNTVFNLAAADITDGSKLTIGDETYVFSVGADSTVEAVDGDILVDLTDLTAAAGVLDTAELTTAIDRLTTAAAGNTMFSVGQTGTDGQISLQEIAGGGADTKSLPSFQSYVVYTAAPTAKQIADHASEKAMLESTLVNAEKAYDEAYTAAGTPGGLVLQIGDTADDFNKMAVSVDDLSAAGLGIAGLDVSTEAASAKSIDLVKAAINQVSTNRANMGALQNRLEYTINNLDTTAENMQAAESRIRDTDMAAEMMEYTKNNVLVQAAQAMLAQANQQPQSVLQLLG